MDFFNLPEKKTLTEEESLFFSTFKMNNGMKVSSKVPTVLIYRFFLSTVVLKEMKRTMDEFKQSLQSFVTTVATKDDVESKYLSKKDSNYEKSKLVTEERLLSLLNDYCSGERIDIDLENCKEHSRSIATALGNSLTTNALIAKTSNSKTTTEIINTEKVIEEMEGFKEND